MNSKQETASDLSLPWLIWVSYRRFHPWLASSRQYLDSMLILSANLGPTGSLIGDRVFCRAQARPGRDVGPEVGKAAGPGLGNVLPYFPPVEALGLSSQHREERSAETRAGAVVLKTLGAEPVSANAQ